MGKRQAVGRPNFNYPQKPKFRKELRKNNRIEKKQKKNSFFMKRAADKILSSLGISDNSISGSKDFERKNEVEVAGTDQVYQKKQRKDLKQIKKTNEKVNNGQKTLGSNNNDTADSGKKKFENHQKEVQRVRKKQLRDENKREERIIKQLEKKLHLNKRKSKGLPKSFSEDGLDYVLEMCDPDKRTALAKEESAFFRGESDTESDQEDDARKKKKVKVEETPEESDEEKGESEVDTEFSTDDEGENIAVEKEETEDDDTGSEGVDVEDDSESDEEDLKEKYSEDTHQEEEEESASDNDENEDNSQHKEVWEDIYGRLRDKKGNVIVCNSASTTGKYIPPALRAIAAESDVFNKEEKARLVRTMKGLLNRLSDSNLSSITDQVEGFYGNHSRSLVNTSLFELIFESIVSPVLAPERLIMVHCLLVSALHANVGPEIGARFLEILAEKIKQGFDDPEIAADENKTADNLVWLICSLYIYKVTASSMVYSLMRRFVDRFLVKDIELILLVLKTVGFMLRKDDPLSLKELIASIQLKASQTGSSKEEARVRFMLETLSAIKNNNMSKIKQYDQEQIEHFRKVLRNAIRKGSSITTLNVSYEELINISNRGRWWLVGSAWSNPSKEISQDIEGEKTPTANAAIRYSQKLLDLAAKMRMNTDVRRNIFCILMSAEDYMEAFEQLLRVNFSSEQRKEIIYVILECALREKVHNPYYSALALKFSTYDRTYQMTLQFALWDKLKEIHSLDLQRMSNLAQFYQTLIAEKGLPISALKVRWFYFSIFFFAFIFFWNEDVKQNQIRCTD
ncbi:hypothetical protein QYM36_008270 [Artemia franciscana]|uniref:MI domain-containing protein n=1 Tax=Artemia franciscana TaxID=6661 RepID=A0AA88IEF4_ARTSF|nr:hypothetical protein QYM36_008270 [Artemia franciscana]